MISLEDLNQIFTLNVGDWLKPPGLFHCILVLVECR